LGLGTVLRIPSGLATARLLYGRTFEALKLISKDLHSYD
jgi:hypothetical protein